MTTLSMEMETDMNNPYNLPPEQRGITPKADFNNGINCAMSKSRRARK